ncbi:hypothetical protein PR202_gb28857 [Eleusine coracana subsp. coracana]|uniref:Phytocyanin domain-containing protein n=1 Tax=Eleusine coracana subsp. coracana TaxID=191504 RepID=A0AAV5FZX7_ELECO|nr:hypothetical protein PR202_gb28857 [Eleusine coracana subsp. coracana]
MSSAYAVFKYSRALHNVLEVSKADYDSCSGSNPINAVQTGDDTIALPAGGVTRYFICGVPGHCDDGMKLAVRVEAADAAIRDAASSCRRPSVRWSSVGCVASVELSCLVGR